MAGSWPLLLSALAALGALWLGPGCSSDIFDVDVALRSEAYQADFGAPTGQTIPTVACDPAAPAACGGGATAALDLTMQAGTPADVRVQVACDGSSRRCFAQAHARIAYTVSVLDDEAFTTKVERRSISLVRVADLAYTIPTNTLTFDVPTIDVLVGPAGARAETDPGVVAVDSIHPVPAGTMFTEERHLTLGDGSAARSLIEQSIRDQAPFVFLLVLEPRLEAGAALPAGGLEVDVFPRVQLGFPR